MKRYGVWHMSTCAGGLGQRQKFASNGMSKRLLVAMFTLAMIIGLYSPALAAKRTDVVTLEQPLPRIDRGQGNSADCIEVDEYYYYTATTVFRLPDPYGDDFFNTRFTNSWPFELKRIECTFYKPSSNDGVGVTLYAWRDMDGFPDLTQVIYSFPINPIVWGTSNFNYVSAAVPDMMAFSGDFHIGFSPIVNVAGQRLGIVADNTQTNGRSSEYWGEWATMLDDWGTDYAFFIDAYKCYLNECPPAITPLSDLTQYEGDTVSIRVNAKVPHCWWPSLSVLDLPENAIFADSGNGAGLFNWIIAPKQYGAFNVSFIAYVEYWAADTETVAIQVSARLPQVTNLSVEGSQTPMHVTVYPPTITWHYIDFNYDDPQLKFEIDVNAAPVWTHPELWDPAPFSSSDTFVVYNGIPLLDGSSYWLRLRVNNVLGWSDWQQIFFHMNTIPTVPQLRFPLAEAIVTQQQPPLIVYNSTDAESDSLLYTFEVSPDNFATTVITFLKKQDVDSLTTLVVDSMLVENSQYWWRVKASDYYESSEYSPVRSFYVNTTNTAPTAVGLTQPVNTFATPLTILRPQFVWTASTDPDPLDTIKYDLAIAIDSNFLFVQQIPNLIATSHTLTTDLLWGKRYWWKVKSLDRHGAFNWSPVFTFRTMTLGDANNDGATDISDVVYLVAYIFSGGQPPTPLRAGDANCDNSVDISDAVYLIAYIFSGGSPPCSAF